MSVYIELREMALELNRNLGNSSLCIKGRGECCVRGTLIVQDDMDLILRAFATGQIPERIKEIAIHNISDPTRKECPFLGRTRRCLIYDFRPLRCVMWGFGGEPINGRSPDDGGNFTINELKHYMCQSCSEGLVENPPIYPPGVIDKSFALMLFTSLEDVTTTGDFAKEKLKI